MPVGDTMAARLYLAGLILSAFTVFGCVHEPPGPAGARWVALFNGSDLDNWNRLGDANWNVVSGVLEADRGTGYLVSKASYADFEIRAEFWADERANSGIFLRCADPGEITPMNAYEVNIWDTRPDPSYGTGAIVEVARVSPMPRAANQWNTYEISAKGNRLTVTLNGVRTVDVEDGRLVRGPIALQSDGGTIRFRRIEIRPL